MVENILLEKALWYAGMGFFVLPLKKREKTPYTKNGLKDATRDIDTIKRWWSRWPNANIGIACGYSGLVVIDADGEEGVRNARRLFIENDVDVEACIISRTGGGGFHYYFAAPCAVEIRNSQGKIAPGVDVRGTGGYIVAPPSLHQSGNRYEWIREPNGPLPELPPEFAKLLADGKGKKLYATEGPIEEGKRNGFLTSLAGKIWSEGRVGTNGLVAYLLKVNEERCKPPLDTDEVESIARSICNNYEPGGGGEPSTPEILTEETRTLINELLEAIPRDIDKVTLPEILRPVLEILATLEEVQAEAFFNYDIKTRFELTNKDIDGYRKIVNRIRKEANGLTKAIKPSEITSERIYKALAPGLIDIPKKGDESIYLMKEGDDLTAVAEISIDGKICIPPPKEDIQWSLPEAEEVIDQFNLARNQSIASFGASLYDDLVKFHKTLSELPNERYYDLLALWDIHTYFLENFRFSPILCFYAIPERGKSRTGRGLLSVSYRPLHVVCLREAYIMRFADNYCGSLFFDVKDLWRIAERIGSQDIILNRFERGAKVPRVNHPERGPFEDTDYYCVFGPTIIATNRPIDDILGTRAITINMPESSRKFAQDATVESAMPLRIRLLVLRALYLGKELPSVDKPAKGRLGDILEPLRQIVRLIRPEREPIFIEFAKELEEKRRVDKADSFEGEILRTIIGLEGEVEKGLLQYKEIAGAYNTGRPSGCHIDSRGVGSVVKAMAIQKKVTNAGTAMIWDKQQLEELKVKYGLDQEDIRDSDNEESEESEEGEDNISSTDPIPHNSPEDPSGTAT